jgi:hypothetical protein
MLTLKLAPVQEGHCPQCDTVHDTWDAHDQTSSYYQLWFFDAYGRLPTWTDAMAHCSEEIRRFWTALLQGQGLWSETPQEAPGWRVGIVTTEHKAQDKDTPQMTPVLLYGDPRYDPREAAAERECG